MSNKIISRAPARVCLFGDHQDYLNLPIIATTIDREISITAIKNNSNQFNIYKEDLDEKDIINLDDKFDLNEKDFLRIALRVLRKYNCIPNEGYDISIRSDIPINSGLSSSSALIIAWVNFLLNVFQKKPVTPSLLAEISYGIEVLEMNGSGGKMDQYTISYGKTIYLDTLTDKIKIFDHDLCDIIVGVSSHPKDTQGLLKKLRDNARRSIEIVKSNIPDFSVMDNQKFDIQLCLNHLNNNLKPYLKAAVGNFNVTVNAVKEFEKSKLDILKISSLINDHHSFLKDELKITTPEIDNMVDVSLKNGAIGSKIVGSGGGGSIISLSNNNEISNKVLSELVKLGIRDAFIAKKGRGPTISYE
tara:strand:- start:50846 stop:51925 length:1080 start_codon:yes stop_codon:yes gene_type:complete